MQISLKWVNELVSIEKIRLEKLIEKLTLGGFEVEEILEIEINHENQIVVEISSTANRSDSLSITGISREIAALLNQPVKIPNYRLKNEIWKQIIDKKATIFSDSSDCSMFLFVSIENLSNKTVPKWILEKLLSSSIIPSNTLLDFQNYILLETGYPFEFYDLEKIRSELKNSEFKLSLKRANRNQKFLASNDISYKLDKSILTINANELPISIAGIIENKNFSISDSTNTILIEASIFNAAKIRQESKKLGLRTDRSARYEKSLRTTYLKESLYKLISFLRISNPNLICKLHTIKEVEEKPLKPILLRYENINEILGPIHKSNDGTSFRNDGTSFRKNDEYEYISPKIITEYLTRLNFKFTYSELKLVWEVEIPHLRTEDITREIDLIEEIGRLHGFNNFLTTLPKLKKIGNEDSNYKTRKKITACLLNLGLNELIHYSLVNQTTFLTNEIELVNPLLSDYSRLRKSLLPNLINTVQENLKQKNLWVEGFEYGHVFSLDPRLKFKEKEYLAGIFGGIKTKLSWTNSETTISWFEAKGKIEQFFNQLNLLTYWTRYSKVKTEKLFHPSRSAEVYFSTGINLGTFGQIHPILANKLNLSSEIYFFEFDLEAIKFQLQNNKLAFYKSYSFYPKIIKDLSFIIQKDLTFEEVQKVLYLNGTEFLSEINLLDEYKGQSIPDQHISLCLQLVFQSHKKTLENQEIENILTKLKLILTEEFNASIRN
jgi:phenylalanyl-tRNA synthetase beta chain